MKADYIGLAKDIERNNYSLEISRQKALSIVKDSGLVKDLKSKRSNDEIIWTLTQLGLKSLGLVEFRHKETDKVFQKIGITGSSIQRRFDWTLYPQDRNKYQEFDISVLWSMSVDTREKALRIEEVLIKKYRKDFILEKFLGKPYKYYSNGFTGISELVDLGENKNKIIESLQEWSKKDRK